MRNLREEIREKDISHDVKPTRAEYARMADIDNTKSLQKCLNALKNRVLSPLCSFRDKLKYKDTINRIIDDLTFIVGVLEGNVSVTKDLSESWYQLSKEFMLERKDLKNMSAEKLRESSDYLELLDNCRNENQQLKHENQQLEHENQQLEQELAECKKQNRMLKKEINQTALTV